MYLQTIQCEAPLLFSHQDNDEKFPIESPESPESPERSERVIFFKAQRNNQQKALKRTMSEYAIVTLASFKVPWILAKHKRSFSEGELVKDCIMESMSMLLEGYANHTEILLRIRHMQLSRRTIVRRITDMSSDLVSQLKIQLIQSLGFSLDLDESTNICDVAQLCVWIRYVEVI